MFGMLIPIKGEQEPAARIPGCPRVLIPISWQKGWIQQSSPWSSYCSRFLNSGFTVPPFLDPPSNLTAHDMWKCRNSLHRSTSDCVARQGGTGGTEVPPAGAEGIAAVLRSWHHVGFLWSTFSTDHSGTTIPLTTLTSWSSCLRSSQVWDLTGMIRYKAGAFFSQLASAPRISQHGLESRRYKVERTLNVMVVSISIMINQIWRFPWVQTGFAGAWLILAAPISRYWYEGLEEPRLVQQSI